MPKSDILGGGSVLTELYSKGVMLYVIFNEHYVAKIYLYHSM